MTPEEIVIVCLTPFALVGSYWTTFTLTKWALARALDRS